MLESWRGRSLLAFVASAVVSTAILFMAHDDPLGLLDVGLFLILGALIYFGQRWASMAAMILWTLEKILIAVGQPSSVVVGIFWWAAYMHIFLMAWKVEGARRKPAVDLSAFD
jgi:hypothetical protein